jgi:hypothetical protein
MKTFDAVRACAIALLAGTVLHAEDVTAGLDGSVIDWRAVKCGETIQAGGDAFETAYLFVSIVGEDAALAAAQREGEIAPVPAFEAPPPAVASFAARGDGARRRSFEVGPFRVVVEPDENDAAQASFTEALARLASSLV